MSLSENLDIDVLRICAGFNRKGNGFCVECIDLRGICKMSANRLLKNNVEKKLKDRINIIVRFYAIMPISRIHVFLKKTNFEILKVSDHRSMLIL